MACPGLRLGPRASPGKSRVGEGHLPPQDVEEPRPEAELPEEEGDEAHHKAAEKAKNSRVYEPARHQPETTALFEVVGGCASGC